MSSLLVFNLATDADDPILGFTTEWLNRLARHFDHIDVITMRAGTLKLVGNVRVWSVGKEQGYSEIRRVGQFYTVLIRCLLTQRYDACFAHMMPLFAVMGAPLLIAFRVPITLWYTHRQAHRTLRWAMRVSRRVVTAAADSFPLPTGKLRVIGHGIDIDFFAPDPAVPQDTPPSIVHVARLMPVKHQATLIRALAGIPGAHAVFVGGIPPEQRAGYQQQLENFADQVDVSERVMFVGDQRRDCVLAYYRRAKAAVNLSPAGLFDKAALESMAAGVPTVVSSPAFDSLLGQHVDHLRIESPDDVNGLSARLHDLLARSEADRAQIGRDLRERVAAAHGLDRLINRLVEVLLTGECAGGSA